MDEDASENTPRETADEQLVFGTAAARYGSAARPVEPQPPPRRRSSLLIAAKALLAMLSVAALATTGIAWSTVQVFQRSTTTTTVIADIGSAPDAPPADDGATDILLVGSDSRTDTKGNPLPDSVLRTLRTEASDGVNTDTIILLRVPKDGGRAYAVSIPRDTYVAIPGYRDDKINSAYGVIKSRTKHALQAQGGLDRAAIAQKSDQAGQSALVQSVQNLTGLRVDHYAEINLYGFYLLTEAIGGVQVCLKHSTSDKDSGADFTRGVHNVIGGDALSFVRQRENLPHGDLDRIQRQQVFLASAAKKVLSAGTLTDPAKLNGLLDTVRKAITLDSGLDLLSFLTQAQALASGNVEFVTIPVTDTNGRNERGQSIVTVDRTQVRQFVAGLVGSPVPSTPATASTSVPPPVTSVATSAATSVVTAPAAPSADQPTDPVTLDGLRCVD